MLIICFETTPIAASIADQETKAYRRGTSLRPKHSGGRRLRNFLVSRGMAQPGEENFEAALQPDERGKAYLRLDQADQEEAKVIG